MRKSKVEDSMSVSTIAEFIDKYNDRREHSSLDGHTSSDLYFRRVTLENAAWQKQLINRFFLLKKSGHLTISYIILSLSLLLTVPAYKDSHRRHNYPECPASLCSPHQ